VLPAIQKAEAFALTLSSYSGSVVSTALIDDYSPPIFGMELIHTPMEPLVFHHVFNAWIEDVEDKSSAGSQVISDSNKDTLSRLA
jgi:hypothetical protein